MYNRYTPGKDGSYRRNRVPDQMPQPEAPAAVPIPEEPPVLPPPVVPQAAPPVPPSVPSGQGPFRFLTDILPKDMDSGDMLVLLILFLLMADGNEEASNPLLTLALFFLMK